MARDSNYICSHLCHVSVRMTAQYHNDRDLDWVKVKV